MKVLAGVLSSLLLRFLLTSIPGALGTNPGLVVRITDKGLEYGKKLWLLAGLGRPAGRQTALHTVGDTNGALSLSPVALAPSLAALAPSLAGSPTHCATWAWCLSGRGPSLANRDKNLEQTVD